MSCNTTRKDCNPNSIFAANAKQACSQFINPGNFQAEQIIYDNSFKDLINSYGVPIYYYVNTFNLDNADTLYGQDALSRFNGPHALQMYIELSENSISLSKFGYAAGDDLTGYLHITTFTDTLSPAVNYASFNQSIEPKAGDLIEVISLGCDRPNGRGAKVFEITERVDQDVSALNPLLGHYVYRLKAKRYEFSFEPNAPQEPVNDQVYENKFVSIAATTVNGIKIYWGPVTEVTSVYNQYTYANGQMYLTVGNYNLSWLAIEFVPSGQDVVPTTNYTLLYNSTSYVTLKIGNKYYKWNVYEEPLDHSDLNYDPTQGTIHEIASQLVIKDKSYDSDINEISKTDILDMSSNNTDIYGTYY